MKKKKTDRTKESEKEQGRASVWMWRQINEEKKIDFVLDKMIELMLLLAF